MARVRGQTRRSLKDLSAAASTIPKNQPRGFQGKEPTAGRLQVMEKAQRMESASASALMLREEGEGPRGSRREPI